MRFERYWAMPNKWTFTIPPIKKLLKEEISGVGVDPFAGENSPAQVTNDIEFDKKTTFHEDALTFLSYLTANTFDYCLYDPPYSITQARKYGKKEFASMRYWKQCKDQIARILKPRGKVICFGWNSNGLGKNRGFKLLKVVLIAHGGSKNDTIVTVERKNRSNYSRYH